jgi:hypothetical protein
MSDGFATFILSLSHSQHLPELTPKIKHDVGYDLEWITFQDQLEPESISRDLEARFYETSVSTYNPRRCENLEYYHLTFICY